MWRGEKSQDRAGDEGEIRGENGAKRKQKEWQRDGGGCSAEKLGD